MLACIAPASNVFGFQLLWDGICVVYHMKCKAARRDYVVICVFEFELELEFVNVNP